MAGYCTLVLYFHLPAARESTATHSCNIQPYYHLTHQVIYICVTLRGRIKEAARTLRKQDSALPENRALSRCEVCFKQV